MHLSFKYSGPMFLLSATVITSNAPKCLSGVSAAAVTVPRCCRFFFVWGHSSQVRPSRLRSVFACDETESSSKANYQALERGRMSFANPLGGQPEKGVTDRPLMLSCEKRSCRGCVILETKGQLKAIEVSVAHFI